VDDPQAGGEIVPVALVEPFALVGLACKGPHDLNPHDVVLQARGEIAEGLIDAVEESRDPVAEEGGHDRQRHERQKGDGRDPGVQGDHHDDDADGPEGELDQFADVAAGEVLDGAHVFDAAGDQLARRGVVVEGEGQMLDTVVHGVAEVVADAGRGPLGDVVLDQIEDGDRQPQSQQQQRRPGKIPCLALHQSVVDHLLQDARHDERQPRDGQERQEGEDNREGVGPDEGAQPEEMFHRRISSAFNAFLIIFP